MASIIWLVGLLTAGLGGWAAWNPKVTSRLLGWTQKEMMYYTAAVIKAAFGAIMLVWGRSCNRPGVIITIGLITLIGSIAAIIAPRSQTKKLMNYFSRQPQWIYRVWGILGVVVGILIIWAGWPNSRP
jgi:uncharacterized protein YjeT (DUF2065 family)